MHASVSPEVFAILSSLVEERTGMHYTMTDRELLLDKIAARADEAGFSSLLDYYYFLRYDDPAGEEMTALVDSIVVNETYMFREAEQLDVVVESFLAPAVKSGRTPRVWSAACSTGEEPFGLGILLAEAGILEQVEIVASDLGARVLSRARSGRVSMRSVRRSPRPELCARWLREEGETAVVDPRVTARIEFRRVNLLDEEAVAALGSFDVVLARNVLIYFRDETTRAVVDRIARRLAPGGALFVGVSESLLRFGSSLACEERHGAFVYRKIP